MDESVAAGSYYEKGDWSAEVVEIINDDWIRVTTGDNNTHINIVNQSGKTLLLRESNDNISEFADSADVAYECRSYTGIADPTTWEYEFVLIDPDSKEAIGMDENGTDYGYTISRIYDVTISLVDGEFEVSYTQR